MAHDFRRVAAGLRAPACRQGTRARIEALGQFQRSGAQARSESFRVHAVVGRGFDAVAEGMGDGLRRTQGMVGPHARFFRRVDGHVQCEHPVPVAGQQGDFIVRGRIADAHRRRWPRAPRGSTRQPRTSVEFPQHHAAKIAPVFGWRRAIEADPHRDRVVGEQRMDVAGRHPVADPGTALAAVRRAPQWRREARDQKEADQCGRQAGGQRHGSRLECRPPARSGQARFQRAQGCERRQQHQSDQDGERERLVEQQCAHQDETSEADRHARVAHRFAFQHLHHQQPAHDRRASLAPERRAVHRDHRQWHRHQHHDPQPCGHAAVVFAAPPPAHDHDCGQRCGVPDGQVRHVRTHHA